MNNAPSVEDRLKMHRRMILVRRLEETLGDLHKAGKTRGPLHRCDGQEAVGIGATAMLKAGDYVTSTHRGHAHYIGKGLDVYPVLAEILGRETGICGGRAGHMLIGDKKYGLLGGNAIVGASIPAAAGMALSIQVRGGHNVALCFFGDGAAQTGICHEAMNMAGLWKLPIIFVLEHNEYGLSVHHSVQSPIEDLSKRASGYAIPAVRVDGNDVVAVYQATMTAVARARQGDGATLIEAKTYRMQGFSTSDMGGYQDAEIIEKWRERDPIKISYEALLPLVDGDHLQQIDEMATKEVDQAMIRALSDPLPSFAYFKKSYPYAEYY